MTSLSRRKRQITLRSTPPETATDPAARRAASPCEPLWLPAGLLAVLATLLTSLPAFGGEVYDSGWSSTATQPVAERPVQRPVTKQTPLMRQSWSKVRVVAFDVEMQSPTNRAAQQGSATLKSIVVQPDGVRREYRVAQEDNLLDSFQQPFGEAPEVPTGEPEFEEPSFGDPELAPLPPLGDGPADPQGPPSIVDPFEEPRDPSTASPSDGDGMDLPPIEDVRPEDIGPPRSRERTAKTKRYREAMDNCAEELAELKASRIAEIDLTISLSGAAGEDFPYECGIDDGTPFAHRNWPQVCYMWKASALCHKPLYFENVQLERYGHSWGPCLQPFVSGAHFFCRLPMLPYCMGLQAPNECVYTLGHYRPGNCAPYLIPPVPVTCRAAAFQGAALTGGIFLFP